MDKEVWVDAICGRKFKNMEFACEMEKQGYAIFTGNQWSPDWEWDKDKLLNLSIKELELLYEKLRQI